ncbi:hypothetical protein [Kangiella sp. HZ709]|uniref:hypothetical protein n=1 Tax=Kangiella sp. HZ709 TaxID=2666328 RepID=UPI0012AEE4A3|nr:hypothetical protein [Kangiella sp. HZ709]MRX28616.1 hypothetical protein [Kangiella sp. HZ709]
MKKVLSIFNVSIISLLLVACPNESNSGKSEKIANYGATQDGLKSMHNDIYELIKDKSCQQDSDCGVVGLGARACGGPDSYAVYSKANIDAEQLQSMTKQLESLHKTYNQENQIMSICMMEPKPGFACIDNQCKTKAASNLIQ